MASQQKNYASILINGAVIGGFTALGVTAYECYKENGNLNPLTLLKCAGLATTTELNQVGSDTSDSLQCSTLGFGVKGGFNVASLWNDASDWFSGKSFQDSFGLKCDKNGNPTNSRNYYQGKGPNPFAVGVAVGGAYTVYELVR